MGLVIAAHLGGEVGQHQPIACGSPTFFWEAHALLCQTGMAHVASFIAHGVFHVNGEFHALLNYCPHKGAELCAGLITGTSLPCDEIEFNYGHRDGLGTGVK